MEKYSFLFVGDISGTPYGKLTIGVGTFLTTTQNKLLQEINKEFPEFRRSRNKGCLLKKSKLKDIIEFLDSKNVHMHVLHFTGEDWEGYKKKYSQKANFKEKMIACLYFQILKKATRANYKQNITLDTDSWMNVNKMVDFCKKLAKANNYDFDFSLSREIQSDLIRVVDYIAASHERVDKKVLQNLKHYHIIGSSIPQEHLDKLFK